MHGQEMGFAPIFSRGILPLCAKARRTPAGVVVTVELQILQSSEIRKPGVLTKMNLCGAWTPRPSERIMKLPFITASIIAWSFLATAVIVFSELFP